MSNPILDILVPKASAQEQEFFILATDSEQQQEIDRLKNELDGTEGVDIPKIEADCRNVDVNIDETLLTGNLAGGDTSNQITDAIRECTMTKLQEAEKTIKAECNKKVGATYEAGKCVCPSGETKDGQCLANNYGTLGINCSTTELIRGNCSLNVSQLLGIREEQAGTNTVLNLLQDVTLGVTSFIGTVLTIGMVIVGLKYIFGGLDEAFVSTAKKGFKYGIIGFFLVIFAYTIVRMIQFLATG